MNNFGTDGIRGPVGTGLFTYENLFRLGKAIAHWSQNKYGNSPRILIGHDTRISCGFIKASLKSGLLLAPVQITDGGILPTPAVAQLLDNGKKFDLGIIISASHNPFQDNGIKIIDGQSGKLSLEDEEYISNLFASSNNLETTYTQFGVDYFWAEAPDIYISLARAYFPENLLLGKKVVLDAAYGATFYIAPSLFRQLGAEVIMLHDNPTGTNINQNSGAVYPEQLQQAVINNQADIGFAFDGDGDRVIAVNKNGILKDGDDILAVLLNHPKYKSSNILISTIMSNQGLENYLKENNKILIRTSVGDKYVAEKLKEQNLLLGGEQSGHIILNDLSSTGDGILAALRVCEVLVATNNWAMHTFTKYPQIVKNIAIKTKKDLNQEPISQIITRANNNLKAGRLLVRYSGTESCLRIMVEEENEQQAQHVAHELAQELQRELA